MEWSAARVTDGTLTPGIARRDSWKDAGTRIRALIEGRIYGKVVLDIGR
ncbi:hypothetical protein ACWEOZ_10570 [Actinoplanes sp. NPDC004185]